MRSQPLLALAVVLGGFLTAHAGDWPQFRGPGGTGQGDEKIPGEWSAEKNVLWKASLPGYGWSSPVIVGDKVFVFTNALILLSAIVGVGITMYHKRRGKK